MEETQNHSHSRRPLFIAIGVVVAVIIVAVIVTLAVLGTAKKQPVVSNPSASPTPKVATKADVQKSLNNLNSSYQKAKSDQSAAQAVITASKNQVKVGN